MNLLMLTYRNACRSDGFMEQLQAITDQLDVTRRLLMQHRLDVIEALAMLNALPSSIRNDHVVRQARDAVSAVAMGTGKHLIVARYALARVIVLLEGRMAEET